MSSQQDNRKYKTALYLRLSKDDDVGGESASITTQRSILQEYAKTHGLTVADEYIDDGFSGTNYSRPGFQRMITDIEAGKINCVITKDLSRLGRNSARTSDLLDEYFPSHGVRYISVIDGYDSLHLTSGVAMTTPLVMAVHEMYARDISNKIRTSFQTKMENGQYIGSFAPYGYKKDEEHGNKNHLVVDCQVAHIVQKIFTLAADGQTPGAIADYLNRQGVSTPAVYRCTAKPYLNITPGSSRKEWTSSIVCKMLRNQVYLGHTIQGKTTKVSFKSKASRTRHRDEWIVVENTHEAIISEEAFRLARTRSVSRRSPPSKGFENVFSGIAKCAACGRNMTTTPSRKKGATYNLCCGGYKTYGAAECSNHFIDYDFLYDAVLQELKGWLALTSVEKEAIIKELEQEQARTQPGDNGVLHALTGMEDRAREISALMKKLYEDRAFERITDPIYKRMFADYEAELELIEKSISEMKKRGDSGQSVQDSYREVYALLDEMTEIKTLTKPLLRKLIDRIEVEQGKYITDENGKRQKRQEIRIYYRFIDCTDA